MNRFFIDNEFPLAATQLSLAMFGIGATLSAADFRRLFRTPRSLFLGTAIQMLVATGIALMLVRTGLVAPAVLTGLMLCALAPGGSTSNIFTHLAGGNTVLSISITILTSFAALLTMPLLLGGMLHGEAAAEFQMPAARLFVEIVVFLFLPMVLGMAYRSRYPRASPAVSVWCIRLSLLVIVLMIAGALGSGRMDLRAFGAGNILTVILFMALHIGVGLGIMLALGISRPNVIAICMETAVRNGSLALLVKASVFPSAAGHGADLTLFTVLLYTGLQSPIALLVTYVGRRSAPALTNQPATVRADRAYAIDESEPTRR